MFPVLIYFKMYFCDGKADISAAVTPVLTAHYPSEILIICWFAVQETFIIIFISVKHTFFSGSFMNRKFNSIYLKLKSFLTL